MNILLVAKLSDSSLNCILEPLTQLKYIKQVYVLRDTAGTFNSEKVKYIVDKSNNTKNIIRHIKKIKNGIALCKEGKIDFIIGVLVYPHGYIGRLISLITGLPYIHVTIAGHREFWVMGKVIEKFNLLVFKKSHAITVTGGNTLNYLVRKGYNPKRIITLPNVINMTKYNDFNQKREFNIISLSRLDKNKNLSLLLRAIAQLNKTSNVNAIIAGDGPEFNNIVSEAVSLGIEKNIKFPGWINEAEKNDMYNSAQIFVLCSKGEGFPLSLLEAMACGCVPVVTDVGDISDVVHNDVNGFLIKDPNNEKELASVLQNLNNPEKIHLISVKAKEIKTRYSFENVLDIWNKILNPAEFKL